MQFDVSVLMAVLIAYVVIVQIMLAIKGQYLAILYRVGGKTLVAIPAFFFVPIHELSHLVAAFVCGHKIEKVRLFQLDFDVTGTLGYVEHSYKLSLLSHFTNLIVGLAPIAGGALTVCMIAMFESFELPSPDVYVSNLQGVGALNAIHYAIDTVQANYSNASFWFIAFIGLNIVIFSVPSNQDFKGAGKGLALTMFLFIVTALFEQTRFLSELFMNVTMFYVFPVLIASALLIGITCMMLLSLSLIVHKRKG
jgi:hypothetical protein